MLVLDQLRRGDQRLRWLAIGVLAGMAILLAGLWSVQVVSARHYQQKVRNQSYRTIRVPAVRGKILDRHGQVLAENRPSYNLNLYIEELRPLFQAEYRRQVAALPPRTNPPPATAGQGWFAALADKLRPAPSSRRLTTAERNELSARVRFDVVSNVVARVAALLETPIPIAERDFRRHHNQWPYRPLTILENLSPRQVARFLEQAPAVPGVDLEVQPVRYYPQGPLAAHVLGYLTRDDLVRDFDDEGVGFDYSLPSYQGAIGLEAGYDHNLIGRPGIQSVTVNSLCYRESESIWTPAEAGQNIHLTLDLDLQRAAFQALQSAGANVRGAVVVLDVTNGDVLAMVSSPSYDPNEFLSGLTQAEYNERMNHPKLKQTFNRATQGAYPPGSIFKIVTALACLEAGLDPAALYTVQPDPRRPGKGAYTLGRRVIKDTAPPGDYDLKRAFVRSSNSYFINHGLRTGRDGLLNMGKRFFLGERIGLPLRQEARGFFPYPREVRWQWTDGNLANASIGQEITVTPLQMALMTAAVANGGHVFWPRLVTRIEPADPSPTGVVSNFPPRLRGELNVPPAHLQLVREAMLSDTEDPEGTGFAAFHGRDRRSPALKGLRVGGKTGTAEIEENGRTVDYITWFTSFAPIENPRFAVVAMVEGGGSGGGTCAPIVRQVYQAIEKRLTPPAATATGRLAANASG